ncbi:hypothetical protein ECL_04782 [Enterobacter cloacae subsp. cloacae ATCC 13047]|uniref:Uncharacterized protein n=1 Tax=Enterobacter cloacae subsp. cloacae (strain ATCC 13047 / DSM 30054 / NBRC 13535 / NCTC 10005 / WDCM 00083 / NCDC 279-56) TaxID=716541 RepID=A0A0H3CST4_ENTCC|nr:hypothetical protein ECL_04782 [Enterobacter cloacae subsp. cloacae ATCC 13047]
MYGCAAAALKLVSERYSDVKFNKRGVKFSEINNLLRLTRLQKYYST